MASSKSKKLFTVDQANAMLPLVQAIVSDLVALSRQVTDRRQRLEHLMSGRDMESGDPYDDELTQIEQELEKDALQLQEYVGELRALGVEPKAGPRGFGLVDFPSLMDGRQVFLCWEYGEEEVAHWHDLDAGYDGRQPLAAVTIAEDSDDA
ncbi:MAG: DUF2203 domain-containing protein [Pirellulaceae bacterium]